MSKALAAYHNVRNGKKKIMRLITNVEYVDRDDDKEMTIETEIVRGSQFVNSRGERICLGIKKDVQDLLGLPFESFFDMNFTINRQRNEIDELKNVIQTVRKMSFWKRLKFLLTKDF